MSRIQDALKQAEDQRSVRTPVCEALPVSAMSSEMLDEVRRLEASLASWRPRPAAPTAPASSTGRWEEDLRRCEATLVAQDTRISRSQEQVASLNTQVVEQDEVVTKAAALLRALQQRLQEAQVSLRQAEAEKAAQAERLLALRRCQALSQAATEAECDFRAHAETVARISRVQQRVNERLSKHQLQAQQLQQAVAQLRRQLNNAVTQAAGTSQHTTGGNHHE